MNCLLLRVYCGLECVIKKRPFCISETKLAWTAQTTPLACLLLPRHTPKTELKTAQLRDLSTTN